MRGIGCQDNTAFKKGASATFWQTRTCHLQSEKAISGPGGVGGGVQGPQVDLAVSGVWAKTRNSVTQQLQAS